LAGGGAKDRFRQPKTLLSSRLSAELLLPGGLMKLFRFLPVPAVLAAVALIAVIPASSASAAVACQPVTNVAVILDDSGSMSGTDPGLQRVNGIKLLLNKSANGKLTMSALEFGSDAKQIFAPGLIGLQRAQMAAALDAAVMADDGSTNYNDAFELRKVQNAPANRILFLTDGGHNAGLFANNHLGGPPVDVIGFGTSTIGEDGTRLADIAASTGGTYYPQVDNSNLPAVMNAIDAKWNCLAPPVEFKDTFTKVGEVKTRSLSVSRTTSAADIVVSWAAPTTAIDVTKISIVSGGRTVAISKRKKATKLKIKRVAGTTFLSLNVKRIKRGKMKIKLRAKALAAPGLPTQVTTQVTKTIRKKK